MRTAKEMYQLTEDNRRRREQGYEKYLKRALKRIERKARQNYISEEIERTDPTFLFSNSEQMRLVISALKELGYKVKVRENIEGGVAGFHIKWRESD